MHAPTKEAYLKQYVAIALLSTLHIHLDQHFNDNCGI